MTTTDLGACEWFVWDLRRSNLIDRGQLDQVVGEFLRKEPAAEPPTLAQYLVDQGLLSAFQAERVLQGKSQGLVLGPYNLMDALGTGSMGTVYKARSKNDQKWYAVKVLPRRSMWNVRIARRQVRAFEQCRHTAVVPFVDVGTAGGTHYLAWPLVEGTILEEQVKQAGKLDPGQAAYWIYQAAEGLDVCHQHDLFHGLLKPSNLMLDKEQRVLILDFGIGSLLASAEGESLVDTMSTANTLTSGLDCASPESITDPSKRSPAGDQYSLGCVLYYCLTGQYPFPEGSALEKMMAHQTRQPTPIRHLNPDVPEGLERVVGRMMRKAPEDRFSGMADFMSALQPFARMPSRITAKPLPNMKLVANPKDDTGLPVPKNRLEDVLKLTPLPGSAQPGRSTPDVFLVPADDAPVTGDTDGEPEAPLTKSRPSIKTVSIHDLRACTEKRSLEDRIGPLGLVLGAVLAAVATWFISSTLFK